MPDPSNSATSPTLLASLRVRPADESAWRQFSDRYQPMVIKWCMQYGLGGHDAADVAQEVLLRLAKAMKDFEYDSSRSFRAWLKTVTKHAWASWLEKHAKQQRGSGETAILKVIQSVEAREDLERRLEEEYDSELKELAMLRVQMRVQPNTWQAFLLTAKEGKSGAEVAEELGMKVANVYVAKRQVLQLLQQEIQRLEPEKTMAQNHE